MLAVVIVTTSSNHARVCVCKGFWEENKLDKAEADVKAVLKIDPNRTSPELCLCHRHLLSTCHVMRTLSSSVNVPRHAYPIYTPVPSFLSPTICRVQHTYQPSPDASLLCDAPWLYGVGTLIEERVCVCVPSSLRTHAPDASLLCDVPWLYWRFN